MKIEEINLEDIKIGTVYYNYGARCQITKIGTGADKERIYAVPCDYFNHPIGKETLISYLDLSSDPAPPVGLINRALADQKKLRKLEAADKEYQLQEASVTENSKPFTIGSIVKLKSGGPKMTIVRIDGTDVAERAVQCYWFEDNKKQEQGIYPEKALVYAVAASEVN